MDLTEDFIWQLVNPAKILKLRVRGTKRDQMQNASLEEVCVVMPGAVARFEGSDIQVQTTVASVLFLSTYDVYYAQMRLLHCFLTNIL